MASYYVVTMYRYGERAKHSYVLGVFNDKSKSLLAGRIERLWRGNKYEYEITYHKVNDTDEPKTIIKLGERE